MSEVYKPSANDQRHSWIEKSFPADRPKRWIIFLTGLFVISATVGYLNTNQCFPVGRVSTGLNLRACQANMTGANHYGWNAFSKEWHLVPILAFLTPAAFILLRRNRFNWLKKTGRWPKEWSR
jgi:hypothetical protein